MDHYTKTLNPDGTISVVDNLEVATAQLSDIMHEIKTDCINLSAYSAPFCYFATSGGTAPSVPCEAKHPGIQGFTSHASNANSGAVVRTYHSDFILGGGEECTVVFKTTVNTGITRYIGLHDSWSQNDAQDGCYIKLTEAVLKGVAAASGIRTDTASTYTVAANTWYRIKISVNSDMSLVTFTLYEDDSDTVLWTSTVATNIPKTGQLFGFSDSCTLATSTGAIAIGYLDYISIIIPNSRRV